MTRSTWGVVAAVVCAFAVPCRAQVVAPPLERRAVEAGFAYKRYERDVTSGQLTSIAWKVASLYGRYGSSDRFTLALEGGLWEAKRDEDARTFSRWVAGIGVNVRLLDRRPWLLFANGTFNTVYDLDESSARSDEETRSWTLGVFAARCFRQTRNRVDVFAGPMFVLDRGRVYPFGAGTPLELETDPSLGVAAGVAGYVFHYIGGFAYVVYAEHAQARLGVSIRSKGGRP